jgi:hypothetical protein
MQSRFLPAFSRQSLHCSYRTSYQAETSRRGELSALAALSAVLAERNVLAARSAALVSRAARPALFSRDDTSFLAASARGALALSAGRGGVLEGSRSELLVACPEPNHASFVYLVRGGS